MERLSKLKIKTRLIVTNIIIIVLACTAIFYSIFNIERLDNNIDLMDNSILPVVIETQNINRNIITVERNLLEMTLTDDQNIVSSLMKINHDKGEEIDKSIEVLKSVLSENDIKQVDHFTKDIMVLRDIRKSIEKILQDSNGDDWKKAEQVIRDEYVPLSSDVRMDLESFSKKIDSSLTESIELAQKMGEFGQAVSVGLSIIFIIAAFFMVRKIIKDIMNPLREIEMATKALSNGDFSQDITYDNSDEFGQVCNSMRESFSELKTIINEITIIFNAMAEGDFTVRTNVSFPGELKQIEISANTLIEKINVAFNEIKLSSEQISLGAEQFSSGAQNLAEGAAEQASSVEELSATLTEISAKVQINSENAKKADGLAIESKDVTHNTLLDMKEMVSAMKEISIASESINNVIKTIDDIAFQTNILALNAAVEAARAGSAGKGFAVVADEVRNLAQKSSESAKDTTVLIQNAIDAVNKGESIAERTSTAFAELANKVDDVVITINEISTASIEQSESIKQITVGVDQISAVVQTNSATSEESASASEELSRQAMTLNELVEQFKLL